MKTVVSHVFNEAFLLPYWLKHHSKLFDHGVIIDYHSTDKSMEIVRDLCPDWTIVTSRNPYFDAIEVDFEVMEIERGLSGWKIALNTTEFLVTNKLDEICASLDHNNFWGVKFKPYCMIDIHNTEAQSLDPEVPLFQQFTFGYPERLGGTENRKRLFHKWPHGAYMPGRHDSFRAPVAETDLGMILWFGYCPWNTEIRTRKLSIFPRIPQWNIDAGFGVHHHKTEEALQADFLAKQKIAFDLRLDPVFADLAGVCSTLEFKAFQL